MAAGEFGDAWIHVAVDAVSKLWLAWRRGRRTDAVAEGFVKEVAERLKDPVEPLYTTDEHGAYEKALEAVMPGGRADVKYGTVKKTREKGRVVHIETTVVMGEMEQIQAVLAESPVSSCINTSFVERFNLSARQETRRCQRKTLGFSKDPEMLDAQLSLFQACFNLVRPHRALALVNTARLDGSRERKKLLRTPAMATGITDAVWSLERLLAYWPVRRAS